MTTQVAFRTTPPFFDRDNFLTPFDKMFDQLVETQFPEMVKTVRHTFNGFLIVGGGIKDVETAENLVKAGADALVIGTFLEKGGSLSKLEEIAKAIQRS